MKDLETFGPNLTKAGKENPYKVPEGYFDSLPNRIQEFCKKEEPKVQATNWFVTIKSQLALATGICLFAVLAVTGYYYSNQFNKGFFHRTDYLKIVEESGTEFDEMQLFEAVSPSPKKDSLKKVSDEYYEYYLYKNYYNGTLLEDPKDIKP